MDGGLGAGHFVDFAALATSIAALAAYQLRLAWRIRRHPEATFHGTNRSARAAWVRRVIAEDLDILAVQTLRNSTMSASLMASTAILLIFGILNLLANQPRLAGALHALNAGGTADPAMTSIKILLLIAAFFTAFFSFALSVRSYNHASYLINVPRGDAHEPSVERVSMLLHRSALYYSVGMRSYYYSVPLVFWLFGPLWLLIATAAMLLILNHLDHLPD